MNLTTEESAASYLTAELGKPCIRATRLTEGYESFVYRAELEDDRTIIVKHVQAYAATSRQFVLDPERLTYEHHFLTLIPPHLPIIFAPFALRLPTALSFSPESHTLLLTDHGASPSLKSFLSSPPPTLTTTLATQIGTNLSLFLATVHDLTTTSPEILTHFTLNTGGRLVSAKVYFHNLVSRAASFGFDASDPANAWLAELAEREADIVLGKDPAFKDKEVLTVGDFWPENVLVSTVKGKDGEERQELVALDFELAKPGLAEFDVGQMAAELWMVSYFTGTGEEEEGDLAGVVLRAFLSRYEEVRGERVDWNRVAIRVGAHLVVISPLGWEARVGRRRVGDAVQRGLELCGKGFREEVDVVEGCIPGSC